MKEAKTDLLHDESLVSKIYFIRGQKVMLDRDLAELYGIETKVLKQAVKRNLNRFPSDFMFELTKTEFENWRSQFVTSNSDKMGLRYMPFCFTEQGIIMLSSVLGSQRAVDVNIRVVRLFIRLREIVSSNKEILQKLTELEKRMDARMRMFKIFSLCFVSWWNSHNLYRSRKENKSDIRQEKNYEKRRFRVA